MTPEMKLHRLEEFYPSQLGEAMKCYFLEKRKCYERVLVKSSTHCARERKGECTFLQTLKQAGVKSEFYYTISRCTKSGGIEREEGRACAMGLGGGLTTSLNAAGRVWLLRRFGRNPDNDVSRLLGYPYVLRNCWWGNFYI